MLGCLFLFYSISFLLRYCSATLVWVSQCCYENELRGAAVASDRALGHFLHNNDDNINNNTLVKRYGLLCVDGEVGAVFGFRWHFPLGYVNS